MQASGSTAAWRAWKSAHTPSATAWAVRGPARMRWRPAARSASLRPVVDAGAIREARHRRFGRTSVTREPIRQLRLAPRILPLAPRFGFVGQQCALPSAAPYWLASARAGAAFRATRKCVGSRASIVCRGSRSQAMRRSRVSPARCADSSNVIWARSASSGTGYWRMPIRMNAFAEFHSTGSAFEARSKIKALRRTNVSYRRSVKREVTARSDSAKPRRSRA